MLYALLFVLMMVSLVVAALTRRKCPHCRATISAKAAVCRYCTHDVPPLGPKITYPPIRGDEPAPIQSPPPAERPSWVSPRNPG